MLNGYLPHENGVTTNCQLRQHVRLPMMGTILADAGYDTGYFGKWHIALPPNDTEAHGFSFVDPTIQNMDDRVPAACDQFFRQERREPFLAVASFVNPHDICQYARGEPLPRGPIGDPPRPEECPPLPDNFEIPDHEPNIIRAIQPTNTRVYPTVNWTPDQWRQYRWAYYRITEKVDAEIGKLLNALRASGQAEDTLIIFTSDHGDGHGAHRWNQKSILYDEETRVPFIVSSPEMGPGSRVDTEHLIATGLDLIPTLCDYATVETPACLQGRSLRPLVEGASVGDWRVNLVVETLLHAGPDRAPVPGRMLRTRRYKYVAYAEGNLREQLFDMEKDLGEMHNLAMAPGSQELLADLRAALADSCRETCDPALGLFLDIWPKDRADENLPTLAWPRERSLAAAHEGIEWLVLITGRAPGELTRAHFSWYGLEDILDTLFAGSAERALVSRYPDTFAEAKGADT